MTEKKEKKPSKLMNFIKKYGFWGVVIYVAVKGLITLAILLITSYSMGKNPLDLAMEYYEKWFH